MRDFRTSSWGVRTEYWTASAGPDGSRRRRSGLIVNVVLVLLAAAVLTWAFTLVRGTATSTAATSGGIRTVTVATGAITATVTADGSLAPVSTAGASFATSGTVTAIYVKVGQIVTKGQLLAQVDPAAAQRALALAEADLAAANDALARAGSDPTPATNQVTLARLAVDDAKAQVAGTGLLAPMAGTVVAVNGTIGSASSAASGTGFIDLADLTRFQVDADFAEADATKVKIGQTATVTWKALPDTTASGTVLAVDPGATTTNSVVTYGVTISVDQLPPGARAGQTVGVSVRTGSAKNVTYVNSAAVTVSGGRYAVTVQAADGTRSTRPITVGLAGDDAYEVTSGLTAGEQVVLPRPGASRPGGGR
jgi:macrolide-specific efflux system membrane fusion protein